MAAGAIVEIGSTASAACPSAADGRLAWFGSGLIQKTTGGALLLSGAAARVHRSGPSRSRCGVDQSAGLAVVGDWRIDNLREMRSLLGLDPDVSETDVLLAAYGRWDSAVASRLTGDFAIIFWDWRRRVCTALTDALGVKPVFYARKRGRLGIGTDVEMIVRSLGVPGVPDDRMIVEHLLWDYRSIDRTYWQEIARLPGGHTLEARPNQAPTVSRYWCPPSEIRPTDRHILAADFRRIFAESVRERLPVTGPPLAHLSGGLDSSLIVLVAAALLRAGGQRSPLITLSQRFPGRSWDEGVFIEVVRDRAGVSGIDWDGTRAVPDDLTSPVLAGPGMRAPRSSGSMEDFQIARQLGGEVIVSGDGGDQIGAPSGVVDDLIGAHPTRFFFDIVFNRSYSRPRRMARLRRFIRTGLPVSVRALVGGRRYMRYLPSWINPACLQDVKELALYPYQPDMSVPFARHVQREHWTDLTGARTATGLAGQYRSADALGVQVTYPFLDRELVELVLSVSSEMWPAPGPGNPRLHRDLFPDLLPPMVRDRKDKAFLSGALAERAHRGRREIEGLLEEHRWVSAPYVIQDEARALFRRAVSRMSIDGPRGSWSLWREVWLIATLEAWLREISIYDAPATYPE